MGWRRGALQTTREELGKYRNKLDASMVAEANTTRKSFLLRNQH
jgi:hypothetical protein